MNRWVRADRKAREVTALSLRINHLLRKQIDMHVTPLARFDAGRMRAPRDRDGRPCAGAKSPRQCRKTVARNMQLKPQLKETAMTAELIAHQAPAAAAGPALSAELFGALINLSGRRRFTSQRVVLYAVLASLGHDGAESTARATLAQLRDAHLTLVEGKGGMPGVFGQALHEAYFGDLQGDQTVQAFISLAGRALDAIAGDGVEAPQLLDQLVKSATPLLSVLNGLTLVYEEQANRFAQSRRMHLQQKLEQMELLGRQARQLAFNAQVLAARASEEGRDFGAVAASMTAVTGALDALVQDALGRAPR